jgi:hypothetical protein
MYKRYPSWVMVLHPSLNFYERTEAWVYNQAYAWFKIISSGRREKRIRNGHGKGPAYKQAKSGYVGFF